MHKSKAVGVVIDCSLRHTFTGRRLIDEIQRQLITFVHMLDEEDVFYLYKPDSLSPLDHRGEQVAAIASYRTDEFGFRLDFALRQTMYVICAQGYDESWLIYLTDRIRSDAEACRRVCLFKQKDSLDCRFLFIGIGSRYSKKTLDSCKGLDFVSVSHREDASGLAELIITQMEAVSGPQKNSYLSTSGTS